MVKLVVLEQLFAAVRVYRADQVTHYIVLIPGKSSHGVALTGKLSVILVAVGGLPSGLVYLRGNKAASVIFTFPGQAVGVGDLGDFVYFIIGEACPGTKGAGDRGDTVFPLKGW